MPPLLPDRPFRTGGSARYGLPDMSTAEEGPLAYGQQLFVGNGLADGRYVFRVEQGMAQVHQSWDELDDPAIATFDASDLPDGALGVCVSSATEWIEYGIVEDAEADNFLGTVDFAEAEAQLRSATNEFAASLAEIVKESGSRMTFRATDRWMVDGATFGEVFQLLDPVALHGNIEFTRNRLKPNVFKIYGLTPNVAPPGFDTTLTGAGGDYALQRVERVIRDFCAVDVRYPYGDRTRINIEVSA